MNKTNIFKSGLIQAALIAAVILGGCNSNSAVIIYPEDGSDLEELAAREVRRYLYLRTGNLLPVLTMTSLPASGDFILVAEDNDPLIKSVTVIEAPAGGFFIKSESKNNRNVLVISGDDSNSTPLRGISLCRKTGLPFLPAWRCDP